MWKRISIMCAALALTWALFMIDGPGIIHGRGRTLIGTTSGPDMNGPSEYRGILFTYAERTDIYENGYVVNQVWVVNRTGIVGTVAMTLAVWAIAGRLAFRQQVARR